MFDTIDIRTASRPGLFSFFWAAMVSHRQRRLERLTLDHISNYDAYLLRDIGIDPRDVADAMAQRNLSLLFHPLRKDTL